MELQNRIILDAALGKEVERVPVWLMRQAGRILPEYRAVRKSLSGFKELVETPERAAEVTIQPVDILGVDAAIIFSDILVVPEAMGLEYQMVPSKGPWFENTIQTEADVDKLHIPDVNDELNYVLEAIKLTKKELNGRVPLIGFAGAPFTIFCYMIEGQGSKTFSKARRMLIENPSLSHRLLEMITQTTIQYLKAQIQAGADMLQIFDSWGGILSPTLYKEFSYKYINQICDAINEVPKTVFAKGTFFALNDFNETNCNTIGLDWNMNINEARKVFGNSKTLQGNLDPCVLYGSESTIKSETEKMLQSFGKQRYIANLGHGVYPDTDFNKVKYFIDVIKNYKYE